MKRSSKEVSRLKGKTTGSRIRPAHLLKSLAMYFSLDEEIDKLRAEEPYERTGVNAKTLVKYPDFRVVLTVVKRGCTVKEHKTEGRFSLQVLQGKMKFYYSESVAELSAGQLSVLEKGIPHHVEAINNSAFLLTLSWKPR